MLALGAVSKYVENACDDSVNKWTKQVHTWANNLVMCLEFLFVTWRNLIFVPTYII
jgi:hypothetical protein